MNNRIRTHHDRDITIHRNIIQILYISLIAVFTQLVKFYILVFFKLDNNNMFMSIFLNSIFRIGLERTKMPIQDLIAAQISIESEDTVDCQGRKGFFELEFTGVYISQREYQMAPHNQL